MLFDLRGAGRRRTVKFVYLALAFIMFAGFVGFSVGSNVSGGLLDAITQGSSGASSNDVANRFRDRVQQLERKTRQDPKDAAAWAALARAEFQLAGVGSNFDTQQNGYTASGRARLEAADRAWQRHLALAKHPDDRVATIMVQVYSALGNAAKAVQAQEVVTEARPKAATFAQLAVYAYEAGQTRKGDLARDKAVSLTPKDQRTALKSQLNQARTQATAAAGATATATPTATPKSGGK
jgi:tetratricopeptide (TPR) repeat protein